MWLNGVVAIFTVGLFVAGLPLFIDSAEDIDLLRSDGSLELAFLLVWLLLIGLVVWQGSLAVAAYRKRRKWDSISCPKKGRRSMSAREWTSLLIPTSSGASNPRPRATPSTRGGTLLRAHVGNEPRVVIDHRLGVGHHVAIKGRDCGERRASRYGRGSALGCCEMSSPTASGASATFSAVCVEHVWPARQSGIGRVMSSASA